jgi:predicted lactoylglutathione lyase
MHEKADHLGSFLIGEHDFVMMLFPEGFKDLDGHRWSVLHMDMSDRPKQ